MCVVSRDVFPAEEELDGLLVGPDSLIWGRASDLRLYLGMVYPLLLQVAHPTVGAGVLDYSDFERRPWGRLLGTLDYTSLIVYGGRDAVVAGRRLRAMHARFKGVRDDGARYSALEPAAYAWVHATLLHFYVVCHARFGRPLAPGGAARMYHEYRGLGRLIGVREHDLPRRWADFPAYFDQMVAGELTRTEAVDRVLVTIRRTPPPLPIPGWLWRVLRVPPRTGLWLGGIGLLPDTLRERFGIRWTAADQASFAALGLISRSLSPVLPRELSVMGPRQLRLRRGAIAHGPLGPCP